MRLAKRQLFVMTQISTTLSASPLPSSSPLKPNPGQFTSGQTKPFPSRPPHRNPLQPIADWLDRLQVSDSKTAHRIAKLIPPQCPFERDLKLFGRTLAHIPPLCKLNPFYDQLVGLRFRALCYLVDECGEDIQSYC